MNKLAILAVLLSATANAQTVTESSNLAMAMNNNTAKQWINTAPAHNKPAVVKAESDNTAKTMAKISSRLDQQLEDKMTRELDYAID